MKKSFFKTTLCLILACFLLPLFGVAQNYGMVSFSYDTNGNRISSSIQFSDDTRSVPNPESLFVNRVSELFGEMEVSLYPNPTPDSFTMLVSGVEFSNAQVLLSTMEGVALEEKKIMDGSVVFDLSSRAAGLYLVRLTADGVSKAWRVLKK